MNEWWCLRITSYERRKQTCSSAFLSSRMFCAAHIQMQPRARAGTQEKPENSIKVYRISVRSQSAFHAVKGSRSGTEPTHTERFAREPQAAFRRARRGVRGGRWAGA